ncbi:MAG: Rha family transcriptional regulator [Clostridiales bacterium]|nr:Rha family transcriptional regulator [Clostridiales bacterium]
MVEKKHKNLLADVRGYISELTELKIQPSDFFKESTYKDSTGRMLPCYDITKKGCEFIAHKLTGIKGTEFTARYINRFHDMAEVISEKFPKKEQPDKKKEKLPSVNMMVKNIKEALHDAGVDSKYIAAEVVRIYSDSGYPVKAPLISDVPKLWDCTTIAKELGIMSESGRPHDKAVSGIIQKLDIFADEVVRTAYSRNGHDGVTVQYKGSVLEKVREWLEENGYPSVIELRLTNGNVNKCRVSYQGVA